MFAIVESPAGQARAGMSTSVQLTY